MAVRNFLVKEIEVGSGVPSAVGHSAPRLYLDIDTNIFYVRGEGDAGWSAIDASIDGLTSSAAELNILDGVTATAAELNAVDLSAADTARTATAAGTGTGTIADGKMFNFITVTSDDANKIIILPAPTPGTHVWLQNGATGYELRSSDPATVGINGGTGAGAESAIGASTTVHVFCVSATNWIGEQFSAAGVKAAVEVAAA